MHEKQDTTNEAQSRREHKRYRPPDGQLHDSPPWSAWDSCGTST